MIVTLLQIIHRIFALALDDYLVVRLGGEYEVGHSHAALGIECLNAALVDEESQVSHLAMYGCCCDGSEVVAEVLESALGAVHCECTNLVVVSHNHQLALL